jgi:hypothetical protein
VAESHRRVRRGWQNVAFAPGYSKNGLALRLDSEILKAPNKLNRQVAKYDKEDRNQQ